MVAIQFFCLEKQDVGSNLQGLTPDPLVRIRKVSYNARQFVTY